MKGKKAGKPTTRLKANSKAESAEGYFEITEAEYRASLAKGLDEETLLKPGRHKFIRGGFKKMHPDYDPRTAKVKISMYIDKDILNFFRARAAKPHAAPYQTQINQALREFMERSASAATTGRTDLLEDEEFVGAVADLVQARLSSADKRKRKAA
ncbi:MAG: BrnA antitoxin family protein [Acidobacteria bacterium]|nr:BrnA antitoxin family protein [Acidobacteriota bacterium]